MQKEHLSYKKVFLAWRKELSKIFRLFETQILSNFVNNTMFWVIKFEWSSDFQHN